MPESISDQAICDDLARQADYDRWLTTLFAPDERRRALLALLAFEVELSRTRESVSQPMLGEIRLQWWRETVDGAFAGQPRAQPLARELAAAVQAHALPRAAFERMIDARSADLDEVPPAGPQALETYAADTAGALNTLLLAVLDLRGEAAEALAREVGIAWSLLGLVRAAPAHAALRRVHLPRPWLAEAGLDLHEYLLRPDGPAVRPVLRRVAELADRHLAAIGPLRRGLPAAARPVLLQARLARLYRDRLRRAGFDPADPALAVSRPRRQFALLAAAAFRRY